MVPRHGKHIPSPARSRIWLDDMEDGYWNPRRCPWNIANSTGRTILSWPKLYRAVDVAKHPVTPLEFVKLERFGFCETSQKTFFKRSFLTEKGSGFPNLIPLSFSLTAATTLRIALTLSLLGMPTAWLSSWSQTFKPDGSCREAIHSATCACHLSLRLAVVPLSCSYG